MLARRNRDLTAQKSEPTPFAARAKDLGALRDAVVDAASVGAGLWISYLFALFYFAIAAGAVTHHDLLLESPVRLPFLNVELPLKAFFILGPLVFLIVHAYVLLHFVLLAGRIGAFHLELEAQISGDDARARLRRQLPSNIFVQSLAGPREVRTGIIGFLLRRIIEISLVAGPIALLVLFQLQFLPYHGEWITSWQRTAVVIDLVLLWILWPRIACGAAVGLRWSAFKRVKVQALLLVSILPVLLVVTIATFPGEWLEENLPSWPLSKMKLISLHKLLVADHVDYVMGKRRSLWSDVLVLPNFEVGNRAKLDAEGKIAISSDTVSLRGRSLEGAVLVHAHLRKADFTGAQLSHASFSGADLREANFGCDDVGIGIKPKCTQLQGASLHRAQLQGASLDGAQLQGASLDGAQLQGASLDGAQLQGALLSSVMIGHLSLSSGAQLQGALLDGAQLQGALLDGAQLQGASLNHVFVWRTQPPKAEDVRGALIYGAEFAPKYSGLDCSEYVCDWSAKSYAALISLITSPVSKGYVRLVPGWIARLEAPPNAQDDVSAKAWADLEGASISVERDPNALSKLLRQIGCAADGAPYVIGGLIRRLDERFEGKLSQEAEVAAAFLDGAKCPGARGLSEENKAKLQGIRDRGLPAPAPSGHSAAAR
jgi:uncharacterized protein YjbI with pentapeptide repeats